MGVPSGRLYAVARQVLDLTVAGITDAPARQYVTQSLPAFDCAEVVVGVDSTISHDGNVNAEVFTDAACLTMRAANLSIWIVRCVPEIEGVNPPTAAEIDASAQALLADPIDTMNALVDAYLAGLLSSARGLSIQQWQALASAGGFGGGVFRVRIDLTAV